MSKNIDSLLLISSGCSHCPAMIENLSKLIKAGKLSRLEIVNIETDSELATELGVRSVPWFKIGEYSFDGVMSHSDLSKWVERVGNNQADIDYLAYQLENQQLRTVVSKVREHPFHLVELVPLLGDLDLPMAVRIGIGAVIEELTGDPGLEHAVPVLEQLTLSPEVQVRADACHYLGICGDPGAVPAVRALLDDESEEVSEIAAETLAMLHGEEL